MAHMNSSKHILDDIAKAVRRGGSSGKSTKGRGQKRFYGVGREKIIQLGGIYHAKNEDKQSSSKTF